MNLRKLILAVPIVLAGLIYSAQSAMACACCGTYKVVHVASWDVLNIRTGPSVHYQKIGAIPAGSACVIKSGRKQGKWHEIIYANTQGWVHSRYLRYMNNPG